MRFALHNPTFLFDDGSRDFTGYRRSFFSRFKPVLYFPGMRSYLTQGRGLRKLLKERWGHDDFEICTSLNALNREADALISFNDYPYLPENQPPRGFRGLKIWHLMDYVFSPEKTVEVLKNGGVDYLLGYANHFEHCAFYRHFYSDWKGRLITVPFGFGDRFECLTPIGARDLRVAALGSVNPVSDPAVMAHVDFSSYQAFYRDHRWTHAWRRLLKESEDRLSNDMYSLLPDYPKTKNLEYDPVALLNQFSFFANDEGLMGFPPARTYEGIACGCILVGADHPCYRDLGFVDGENCILHQPLDIDDFLLKVRAVKSDPERMHGIAEAGYQLAWDHYTHESVAAKLGRAIELI